MNLLGCHAISPSVSLLLFPYCRFNIALLTSFSADDILFLVEYKIKYIIIVQSISPICLSTSVLCFPLTVFYYTYFVVAGCSVHVHAFSSHSDDIAKRFYMGDGTKGGSIAFSIVYTRGGFVGT